MKTCGENCIPCCDYCHYAIQEVESHMGININMGPIGCSLHKDKEHQMIAKECSYCEDFVCSHSLKNENN